MGRTNDNNKSSRRRLADVRDPQMRKAVHKVMLKCWDDPKKKIFYRKIDLVKKVMRKLKVNFTAQKDVSRIRNLINRWISTNRPTEEDNVDNKKDLKNAIPKIVNCFSMVDSCAKENEKSVDSRTAPELQAPEVVLVSEDKNKSSEEATTTSNSGVKESDGSIKTPESTSKNKPSEEVIAITSDSVVKPSKAQENTVPIIISEVKPQNSEVKIKIEEIDLTLDDVEIKEEKINIIANSNAVLNGGIQPVAPVGYYDYRYYPYNYNYDYNYYNYQNDWYHYHQTLHNNAFNYNQTYNNQQNCNGVVQASTNHASNSTIDNSNAYDTYNCHQLYNTQQYWNGAAQTTDNHASDSTTNNNNTYEAYNYHQIYNDSYWNNVYNYNQNNKPN